MCPPDPSSEVRDSWGAPFALTRAQECQRFEVSRMGKHIENTRCFESKAMFVHQHAQVPCEAPWMAGNIQHPLRLQARHGGQHFLGSSPGRIQDDMRKALPKPG